MEKFDIAEHQVKFIEKIFKRYDKDKDGVLSDGEMLEFLKNIFSDKFLAIETEDVLLDIKKRYDVTTEGIDKKRFIGMFYDGVVPVPKEHSLEDN